MSRIPVVLVFLLLGQGHAFAMDYRYKQAQDFEWLESFRSVDAFEANYRAYVQDCLDHTYGGSGGVPCFIGEAIWDREMNRYYKRLLSLLDEEEKKLLRNSQRAWLKMRDSSIAFGMRLLGRTEETGSMYALMRAGDIDSMVTPMVKQRALMLKQWWESLREQAEGVGR